MFLTEDESKRKQCCSDTENACVGSLCMGWRWYDPPIGHRVTEDGSEPKTMGEIHHHDPRRGYCGLAGHPGD